MKRQLFFVLLLGVTLFFSSICHFYLSAKESFTPVFKWSYPLDISSNKQVAGDIALDYYGNIYVSLLGSSDTNPAMLLAINPNGIKKWMIPLRNISATNPIIDDEGHIFVHSSPSLYSFSASGTQLWEKDNFPNLCNLSLSANQIIYSSECIKGGYTKKVMATSVSGDPLWESNYENNSKIVIDSNNNLLLFHYDRHRKENNLVNINGTSGALIWMSYIRGDITPTTGIIVTPDQSILINLKSSLIHLNKDGSVQWQIYSFFSRNPPVIDQNGMIYAYNEIENAFYILNSDGTTKWKKESGVVLPSYISENGLIHFFFANEQNETFLQAIDPEGRDIWSIPLDPNSSCPAVSRDGTIYGIYQEQLVAWQGNSKLSFKGWPRSNHDNQNTNCISTEEKLVQTPKNVKIEMNLGSSTALVNDLAVTIEPPFLFKNRTFIPFRFLGEYIGAEIEFTVSNETKLVENVSFTTFNKCVSLFINQTKALLNGAAVVIDSPPIIRNNRTFIPLRFVSEALGAKVYWDPVLQLITILYEE